jgi:ABC-type nitrate/sulfonate/bicarbonate transport system substrate-binding protein
MTSLTASRRDVLGLLGAGAACAVLPGYGLAQTGAATPIALGYQNTSWGIIGMIAEAEGIFKQVGANVTVYRFDGGKTTRDAMVAGRVDIGTFGSTPYIVGASKGEIVAIGMAMYAGRTLAVVAGAKSGITDVKDLKGKKVGTQIGSTTDAIFQNKILPSFGLSSADITPVNIGFPNHVAALAAGSIDAFAGVEPYTALVEVNGIGKPLVDYSKYDITPVVLSATLTAIETKREALVGFLRGWLKAIDILKNDQPKSIKIIQDNFKGQGFEVSEDAVKLMLSKVDVTPDFMPELRQYMTKEAEILLGKKQISEIPDWKTRMDETLLRDARKSA